METLETLAQRIDTTESLTTVVRTMKSLSVVKVRQFERAHRAIAVHGRTIALGLQALLMGRLRPQPTERHDAAAIGAVILGSDYGLCGRFNEQVVTLAYDRLRENGREVEQIPKIVVGHRAAHQLAMRKAPAEIVFGGPNAPTSIVEATNAVLVEIDRWREAGGIAKVLVFRNVQGEHGAIAPRESTVLPVDESWLAGLAAAPWPSRSRPTYTLDFERLLEVLLRQQVFVTLYRSIVDSLVAEHATRLAVMQAAEHNIRDHLDELNAEFRRLRQESITAELLDAIGGYEALGSGYRRT